MSPTTPPTSGSEDSPRPVPTTARTARKPTVTGSSPYPTPAPYSPATPTTANPPVWATLGPPTAPAAPRRDAATAICAAIHRSLGPAEVSKFVRFAVAALRVHCQLFPGGKVSFVVYDMASPRRCHYVGWTIGANAVVLSPVFADAQPPAPEYMFALYMNFRAVSASLVAYTETIEVQLEGDVEALFEQLLSAEG